MVGDGEPSDSGWEFAVSGMLRVTDVGETASSVVTVMCESAPSDSEWDFVELQSISFSKKRNFACVENQEDMKYEGTPVKALSLSQKRDEDAAAAAWLLFVNGRRKSKERTGKNGYCKDGAAREQQ